MKLYIVLSDSTKVDKSANYRSAHYPRSASTCHKFVVRRSAEYQWPSNSGKSNSNLQHQRTQFGTENGTHTIGQSGHYKSYAIVSHGSWKLCDSVPQGSQFLTWFVKLICGDFEW